MKRLIMQQPEISTLIVYAQLILENAEIYKTDRDVVEQIFCFLVKDFSGYSLQMILNHENSAEQEDFFHKMIKKPLHDADVFERTWKQVYALREQYTMSE